MATATKKRGERKSGKKLDDSMSVTDKTEDNQQEVLSVTVPEDESPIEEVSVKSPTPEPVYEEPVLTQLIVTCYEGEKAKGLYHGEGRASFVGDHSYQGQFVEGMMHGHGNYIWASGLKYQGEFTHNKISGRGLYQWPDGSTYNGEVLDGLRHGFGTFMSNKGLSYTGQWHAGKRNGKGRMIYDEDGFSYYDGDWVNNVKHGFGSRQYPSGNMYQGMWYNNVRHGEGTMRWLDREQMFTGNWEKGIQHGAGQHIWFLHRRVNSQYPLRNMYDGEFRKGLRHGYGTFIYANGARYEGEWFDNMKSGKGKFIFKNGRVYEGFFEKDHIMEYPSFTMDGNSTPDLTQIRTRTPLPTEQISVQSNDSRNTYGPSFQLEVHRLLQEFTETDREEEATQVIFVIMRYMTVLRKIYSFYSQLGFSESADNTFIMSRMQFWRFLKDCRLHHHDTTLADMDRVLAEERGDPIEEAHNPHSKILMREFVNNLVSLSFYIYEEEHNGTTPVLQWCLSKLITDNILPNACSVHGNIYEETRRAENALVHVDQAYEMYKALCKPRKQNNAESTMKMREFLFLVKDLKLLNNDLTPKAVIDVLAIDDPKVTDPDGAVNLELEMTFLEFFEALLGCAQIFVTEAVVKDPTTPRPSTTMTGEQSVLSMTGSPSRGASQVGLDEGGEDGDGMTPHPAMSDAGSPIPRAASEMTQKTIDGSTKHPEHISHANTGSASEVGRGSQHTHAESTRKSAEGTLADAKKSASFMSSHSTTTVGEHGLAQSVASLAGAHSEGAHDNMDGEDINLEEEDELDEATRQFNFWTHQVHIFFVRKFFPASQRNLHLLRMIAENYTALPEAETAVFHLEALESESAAIPHDHTEYDASSHNEVAHSDIVEEQESTAES